MIVTPIMQILVCVIGEFLNLSSYDKGYYAGVTCMWVTIMIFIWRK